MIKTQNLRLDDVLATRYTPHIFDTTNPTGRYAVTRAMLIAQQGNTVFYGVYRNELVWLSNQPHRSTPLGDDMLEIVEASTPASEAVLLDIAIRFATPDAPAFDWSLCIVKERAA